MPPPSQNIAQNTTYLTSALIIQKVLSFFFFLLIARALGSEGTGDYVAAFALSSIFSVFIDLGLGPVLVRELARDRSKSEDYLGNVVALKLILSLIVFASLLFTVFLFRAWGAGHPPFILVVAAGAVMVIDSFILTGTSVFRGWQNLWFESVVVALNKVFILGLGAAILYWRPASINVGLTILAGSFLSFAALSFFLYQNFNLSWRPRLSRQVIKELWRLALPFALAGIFAAVYAYSDSVLLNILKGNKAVGLYSVAAKTMNAFQFIPSAFMAAVFPVMSGYYLTSVERLQEVLEQSLRYLLIISAPLATGLFLFAEEFVIQLGSDYRPAAEAVRILMPSLIFVFLSFPLGALLNATDRQHWQTTIIGLGMVLNIALNLWLIPPLSYIGASWSWFATNALVLLIGLWLARSVVKYRLTFLLVSSIRIGLAVIIMGWLTTFLKPLMPLIVVAAASGLAYGIALFAFQELRITDLKYLWQLLRKRSTDSQVPAVTPEI